MKNSIALIGFMGTGKTAVGRLLADKLGKRFVETDELVAKRAGKSISEIFEQGGEGFFRELEHDVIKDVAELENLVISCGGGAVLNKANVNRLKKNCVVILLTASPEVIQERTSNESGRPLLLDSDKLENIKHLLGLRKHAYKSAADFSIDTTTLQVSEVVDKIIDRVSK